MPAIGSADGFDGDIADPETFYSFTNFSQPPTVYRLDVHTREFSVFKKPELAFDPKDFITEQVFIKSRDGTSIPMFLVYKKGLKPNGKNPTHLYGYGGFRTSLTPGFKTPHILWLERGGLHAFANVRGGGEYGQRWHEAGRGRNKSNTFDDFIAGAEWLIENNYTSPKNLAIAGRSNGGLLVAACFLKRPELFAAALPSVGVFDLLRFHKFTVGWAWQDEYGRVEDKEEFENLLSYSPLHNIKSGQSYPATLIAATASDDRVFPSHSYKFAAALQKHQGGEAPILIRIQRDAGHAMSGTDRMLDEALDTWSFMLDCCNPKS